MRHTGTPTVIKPWDAVDEDHGGGIYTGGVTPEGSLSSLEL